MRGYPRRAWYAGQAGAGWNAVRALRIGWSKLDSGQMTPNYSWCGRAGHVVPLVTIVWARTHSMTLDHQK